MKEFLIENNIKTIQENIKKHCAHVGRNYTDVTLIAVSKTKPVEIIKEAVNLGMLNLGENKVQEIMDKYPEFSKEIHWHMIGHLQRNKVKYIIDKVSLIHSVDSLRLAEQIDKEAAKKALIVPILIQLNISEEDSKFGLSEENLLEIVTNISKLEHVKIEGLMTVAPYVVDSEENRTIFRKMKHISVDIASKNIDNVSMRILSMGMTNDYEVAIEEGSTMIRIGTAIFGNRNYN
jgi:pyridoxal phosphate enzyme (YggS family)